MPPHLSQEMIAALHGATIALGLDRSALLSGVAGGYVASLPTFPAPTAQLLSDLNQLNRVTKLTDGSVPLVTWLETAKMISAGRAEGQVFSDALAKIGGAALDPIGPTFKAFVTEAPFDFSNTDARSLFDVLVSAYSSQQAAELVLGMAGVNTAAINMGGSMQIVWMNALKGAAAQGRLSALVSNTLADPNIAGFHPKIRAAVYT